MKIFTSLLATIAILFSMQVSAAETPTLTLCTGGAKGNYYFSGMQIREQAKGALNIEVINTKGTWDNLQKMARGECDAAIIQGDGWSVWNARNKSASLDLERVDVLYKEYVHFYCNRESGIDEISDIENENGEYTMLIGKNGSGHQVTWQNFVLEDGGYGPEEVKTLPIGGSRARTKVKAGIDAQCGIYVAGLNSRFMQEMDRDFGEYIRLIDIDDNDFNDTVDPAGNKIYEFVEIDSSIYRNIVGIWDIDTIAVPAVLVVKADWIDANEDNGAYDGFIDYQMKAQKAIRDRVGQ